MHPALRIVFIYTVVGILWILLSDTILAIFTSQATGSLDFLQTIKGTLFVLVTASGLYALLRREFLIRSAREHEARLFFTASPLPMWIFDAETLRFLEVNAAAERQSGSTAIPAANSWA